MKVEIIEKVPGEFIVDISDVSFRTTIKPDMSFEPEDRIVKIVDEMMKDFGLIIRHKLKQALLGAK